MDLQSLFLEEELNVLDEVKKHLTAIKLQIEKNQYVDYNIQKPERIVVNILLKKLKILFPASEISETMIRDNHYFRINHVDHLPYTVDECVIAIDLKENDLRQFEIKKRKREIEALDPEVKVDLTKNKPMPSMPLNPTNLLPSFASSSGFTFGNNLSTQGRIRNRGSLLGGKR